MGKRSSRALWTDKLLGKSIPKKTEVPQSASLTTFKGLVLGVDPSLRGSGLAVVRCGSGQQFELLHSQTVKVHPKKTLPECLKQISETITSLLKEWPCEHVAIEETIYVQNNRVAQSLGAARGAAIAAVALQGIPVFEYAPLRIKQAVVGTGKASKEQMAKTVKQIVNHSVLLPHDESDAAGAALCHAMTYRGL